jgi:hypothetical protein
MREARRTHGINRNYIEHFCKTSREETTWRVGVDEVILKCILEN